MFIASQSTKTHASRAIHDRKVNSRDHRSQFTDKIRTVK